MESLTTGSTDTEIASFYNFSRRSVVELRTLGRRIGDLPPFDNPPELSAWYDRLAAAGHRKHRTPESVLDRAAEALAGRRSAAQAEVPARETVFLREAERELEQPMALPHVAVSAGAGVAWRAVWARLEISVRESAATEDQAQEILARLRSGLNEDLRKFPAPHSPVEDDIDGENLVAEVAEALGLFAAAALRVSSVE